MFHHSYKVLSAMSDISKGSVNVGVLFFVVLVFTLYPSILYVNGVGLRAWLLRI